MACGLGIDRYYTYVAISGFTARPSDTMSGGKPKPPPPLVSRPGIVDTGENGAQEQLSVLCEYMIREFLDGSI